MASGIVNGLAGELRSLATNILAKLGEIANNTRPNERGVLRYKRDYIDCGTGSSGFLKLIVPEGATWVIERIAVVQTGGANARIIVLLDPASASSGTAPDPNDGTAVVDLLVGTSAFYSITEPGSRVIATQGQTVVFYALSQTAPAGKLGINVRLREYYPETTP